MNNLYFFLLENLFCITSIQSAALDQSRQLEISSAAPEDYHHETYNKVRCNSENE